MLNGLVAGHNAKLLDELLADGLISKIDRDKAIDKPFPLACQTPSQALAYMVDSGAMSMAQFDATLVQVQAQEESSARTMRLGLMEEASATITALQTIQQAETSMVSNPALRKGLGVLVVCMLLGGGYQVAQWLNAGPGCHSGNTIDAIQTMFSPAIGSPLYGSKVAKVKLTGIQEVGYVPAQRQRGCTATLAIAGESLPYTYIVGPLSEQDGDISVTGAQRAIVEARFGHIGDDGDFGNQAPPIGREQLEAALRAGVDSLPGPHSLATPDSVTAVRNIFNRVSEQRTREIADIEPIGACRALKAGTRYTCRVLVERNDPLMASFGMGADILDTEFTFERKDTHAPWRMAENFSETFYQALTRARMTRLTSQRGG